MGRFFDRGERMRKQNNINNDVNIGISHENIKKRKIPKNMKTKDALAYNQNSLAVERTEFSKIRTDLALTNTQLAINQTHLAYLRTVVSLVGSAATIYKALPLLGVAHAFSNCLSIFLILAAIYFLYQDCKIYPKMNRRLRDVEARAGELDKEMEEQVYRVEELQNKENKE